MNLCKTYRFRIYPNKEQEQKLLKQTGACRFVWNWALEQRIKTYNKETKKSTKIDLSKMLTELKQKEETKWLKECEAHSLQQVLRDLDKAYGHFFRRVSDGQNPGFPKFKSKHRTIPSFRCTQKVWIEDSRIRIPIIGLIKIKQHQKIEHTFKSVTVKRNKVGHWYVTLVCHFEMPDVPLPEPKPENIVGLDAGLIDFYILSDNTKELAPKFFRMMERKLRRVSKAFSRTKKGSKRREKTRKKLAKVYEKVSNQRKDFLHKKSHELVQRYDGICVESLNISGLMRTKLAKSFNDAGHGIFRGMLQYKCLWNRKHFQAIDRWFPSSKMCNNCGWCNNDLKLSDREWTCPRKSCRTHHNRDLNAAINIKNEGFRILAEGYSERLNARRDDVRLCPIVGKAIVNETRTVKKQMPPYHHCKL